MKKGIVKSLEAMFGAKIPQELAEEFQEELDEIKEILKANKGIENIPNLEYELCEIDITSQYVIDKDFKTKIEHDSIVGVFVLSELDSLYDSRMSIQVDRKFILAEGRFHFSLIEKVKGQSIAEAMYRTDIKIDTSDVHVSYLDPAYTSDYKVSLVLICKKR